LNNQLNRGFFLLFIFSTFLFSWNFHWMNYWKSFNVYVHESFHALSAILFGAKVLNIQMHNAEFGSTSILNTNFISYPIIVSSGYLGNSLLGSLFIYNGFKEERTPTISILSGIWFLFCVISFSNEININFYSGFFIGIALILTSIFNFTINSILLIFIGTSLTLYSVYDFTDFFHSSQNSDAGLFAYWLILTFPNKFSSINIQTLSNLIGYFWIFISSSIILYFLYLTFISKNKEDSIAIIIDAVKKGNVNEETAVWFLKKGIDLDGKPINTSVLNKYLKKDPMNE
jgi:hypothetical protein